MSFDEERKVPSETTLTDCDLCQEYEDCELVAQGTPAELRICKTCLGTLRAETAERQLDSLTEERTRGTMPWVQELQRRLATERAEVKRLNDWADGMADTVLKERRTAEAHMQELRNRCDQDERNRKQTEQQRDAAAAEMREKCARACTWELKLSEPRIYLPSQAFDLCKRRILAIPLSDSGKKLPEDVNRWRKLQRAVNCGWVTVHDYRSPPWCNLEQEIDALKEDTNGKFHE